MIVRGDQKIGNFLEMTANSKKKGLSFAPNDKN